MCQYISVHQLTLYVCFVGGKNLMIASFLGDELTLDGIGLADGADVFVWNGKEVKEPNTFSACLV